MKTSSPPWILKRLTFNKRPGASVSMKPSHTGPCDPLTSSDWLVITEAGSPGIRGLCEAHVGPQVCRAHRAGPGVQRGPRRARRPSSSPGEPSQGDPPGGNRSVSQPQHHITCFPASSPVLLTTSRHTESSSQSPPHRVLLTESSSHRVLHPESSSQSPPPRVLLTESSSQSPPHTESSSQSPPHRVLHPESSSQSPPHRRWPSHFLCKGHVTHTLREHVSQQTTIPLCSSSSSSSCSSPSPCRLLCASSSCTSSSETLNPPPQRQPYAWTRSSETRWRTEAGWTGPRERDGRGESVEPEGSGSPDRAPPSSSSRGVEEILLRLSFTITVVLPPAALVTQDPPRRVHLQEPLHATLCFRRTATSETVRQCAYLQGQLLVPVPELLD
ncbi:hypothetical protein EYF80_050380 [Liparis tanakae]|uniref:Uncharacterized protein n=1 Tax=Liparis tanakae TaxID=230148 RepID=A0A4Z2FE48_9TELE|nr:hypothetical protein EYF80_050380 [Liparis tanakae]